MRSLKASESMEVKLFESKHSLASLSSKERELTLKLPQKEGETPTMIKEQRLETVSQRACVSHPEINTQQKEEQRVCGRREERDCEGGEKGKE